ncbi:MAG: hypothetical protein V1650_00490 [Candidatus Omnitrophota bacterium]
MKKRKTKQHRRYKQKPEFPVQLVVIFAIIIIAIGGAIGYIWRVVTTAEYFRIKDVAVREQGVVDFSYLKGKNIFDISLGDEIGGILERYPNYSQIKLVRILPNRIYVDFIRRRPVAFVKLAAKFFAVDSKGVIFYIPAQAEDSGLPLILGLENKASRFKLGKKNNIRELYFALYIIYELKSNRALHDYKISRIDVSSSRSAEFFISFADKQITVGDLQVKISPENLREKVGLLAGLVTQGRSDLANVEYVDLRFKEAVIKLKDVKNAK